MEQLFSADEIFGIGVEIEKNGRAFYTAAGGMTTDSEIKKLLIELASWESRHIEVFGELRKRLPPSARNENLYDPDDEISLYLKATADNHVFIKNSDMEALAGRCKSAAELLDLALTFEKDSVVFYSAVREAVAERLGKTEIERIIHEELTHIAFLTKERRKAAART